MDAEQFSTFRHSAVHDLMRLNDRCEEEFLISSWPRWDYDLDCGTLTFSRDGVPKVVASIEVVGTTSVAAGTWLWSWANDSLPTGVTTAMNKVRAFGETENIVALTEPIQPDDEYLGCGLTAIAAKVLGAKGAYRWPGDDGFIYVVYSSIRLNREDSEVPKAAEQIQCATHGSGFSTFVCQHLAADPAQRWFSATANDENKWPDAWCAFCNIFFEQEGEWNEKNESKMSAKLLCHHCYERLRSQPL